MLLAIETTGRTLSAALAYSGGAAVREGADVAGAAVREGADAAGAAVRESASADGAAVREGAGAAGAAVKESAGADGAADRQCADAAGAAVEDHFEGSNRVRIIEKRALGELNHLTGLVPMIGELLDEAGGRISSLDAIAVSSGPGSFTGIRIGISAARAIAQVTGLSVIKVPTLETFVYGYEPGEIVCPMLDARRGQVYAGAYRLCLPERTDGRSLHEDIDKREYADGLSLHEHPDKRGRTDGLSLHEHPDKRGRTDVQSLYGNAGKLETLVQGAAWEPDEFLSAVHDLGARRVVYVRDEDEPQIASSVLKWAMAFGEPMGYDALEPIYMRMAEAQRKLEERLAQERCGK